MMALWVSRILFYHIIYVLLELNAWCLLQRSFCYTLMPFILLFINVSLVSSILDALYELWELLFEFELFMYFEIFEYLFHILQLYLWLFEVCCFVSTVMTCPWTQMGKLEDVSVSFMLDNLHLVLVLVSVFILICTRIKNLM